MNDESVVELQMVFDSYDNQKNGTIEVRNIGDCFKASGLDITERELKTVLERCQDVEFVGFELFLDMYQCIAKARSTKLEVDLINGLSDLDRNGDGYISAAEMRHLLTNVGEKLNDSEADELLNGQVDSEGRIKYKEFVKMVLHK